MSTFNFIASGSSPLEDNEWNYADGIKLAWNTYTNKKINTVLIKGGTSSVWLVCGSSGQLATSSDQITWTDRTQNLIASGWDSSEDITCGTDTFLGYATGQFIICGSFGTLAHSTDGINWVTVSKIYEINSSYSILWSRLSLALLRIASGDTDSYLTQVPPNAPPGTTRLRGDLDGGGAITLSDGTKALRIGTGVEPVPTSGWIYDYLINDININNAYLSITTNNSWYLDNYSEPNRHEITSISYIKQLNKLIVGGRSGQLATFNVSETGITAWTSIDIKQVKLIEDSYYQYVPHLRNIPVLSISWSKIGSKELYLFGSSNNCFWASDENLNKFYLKVADNANTFNPGWYGSDANNRELTALKVIASEEVNPTLVDISDVYIAPNTVRANTSVSIAFVLSYKNTKSTKILPVILTSIINTNLQKISSLGNITIPITENKESTSEVLVIDTKTKIINKESFDIALGGANTIKRIKSKDYTLSLSVNPDNTLEKVWPITSDINYTSSFKYYINPYDSYINTEYKGLLVTGQNGELSYKVESSTATTDWLISSLTNYLTDSEVSASKLFVNSDYLHITSISGLTVKNLVFSNTGNFISSYSFNTNFSPNSIRTSYSNGTATYIGCSNGVVYYLSNNNPVPVMLSNHLRNSTSWTTSKAIDAVVFDSNRVIVFGYDSANNKTVVSQSNIVNSNLYLINDFWTTPVTISNSISGAVPKKAVYTGTHFILFSNHPTNGTYYSVLESAEALGSLSTPQILTGWTGIQCVDATYEPITGTICVVGSNGKVSVSTDNGNSWTEKTTNLTSTAWSTTTPVGVHNYNGKIIVYGNTGKLAQSNNGGNSWDYEGTLTSTVSWSNKNILSFASTSSNRFALGTSTGVLAKSLA